MIWNNDSERWSSMPLSQQLEKLRIHYCTGPCGSSQSVMGTRQATNSALREAIERLEGRYDDSAELKAAIVLVKGQQETIHELRAQLALYQAERKEVDELHAEQLHAMCWMYKGE